MPFFEREEEGQSISATFYGVTLEKNNPFLKRNLDRLEKRFKSRYHSSLEKNQKRIDGGKAVHKTVLKSMEDNRKRLLMTRIIRHLLLEEGLNLEMEIKNELRKS